MVIATVIVFCVLVFVVALLWPRMSGKVERGGSKPLGAAGSVAGSAPGPLGRWLRKPFSKGQSAIHKSGSAGRRAHDKVT
jgi:hypothetical protein